MKSFGLKLARLGTLIEPLGVPNCLKPKLFQKISHNNKKEIFDREDFLKEKIFIPGFVF